MSIAKNYRKLREEIPDNVTIVLAGKTKTAEEIVEAIEAGTITKVRSTRPFLNSKKK